MQHMTLSTHKGRSIQAQMWRLTPYDHPAQHDSQGGDAQVTTTRVERREKNPWVGVPKQDWKGSRPGNVTGFTSAAITLCTGSH